MIDWAQIDWTRPDKISRIQELLDKSNLRHPSRIGLPLKRTSDKDRESYQKAKRMVHWTHQIISRLDALNRRRAAFGAGPITLEQIHDAMHRAQPETEECGKPTVPRKQSWLKRVFRKIFIHWRAK